MGSEPAAGVKGRGQISMMERERERIGNGKGIYIMHDYESRVGIHVIKAPLGIRIACHTGLIPIGGATFTKQ